MLRKKATTALCLLLCGTLLTNCSAIPSPMLVRAQSVLPDDPGFADQPCAGNPPKRPVATATAALDLAADYKDAWIDCKTLVSNWRVWWTTVKQANGIKATSPPATLPRPAS